LKLAPGCATAGSATRRWRRHMRRIEMILESMVVQASNHRAVRRGLASQREQRRAERAVRVSALATLRWMRRRGASLRAVAGKLGMKAETPRRWARRWKQDRMELHARGRPARHPDRELRADILAVFWVMGPHVGLPILQELFPDVARSELIELGRRYR